MRGVAIVTQIMIVSRFAPSPNGPLHLGHALSAIVAHDAARDANGRALLRIEDVDATRARPQLVAEYRADMAWLGLDFDETAPQSLRLKSYAEAADRLKADGLLYPCRCSRAEQAVEKPAAEDRAADRTKPARCRVCRVGIGEVEDDEGSAPVAWRLDIIEAMRRTGPLSWVDMRAGPQNARPDLLGDVVLVPKHAAAAYHLAATLDDAADEVTLVTRGQDLFAATHIHRLLQALLDLPVPQWLHHPLIRDESGEKLSKSRFSASLADRRRNGEDGRELAQSLRGGKLPAGLHLS